MNYTKSWNGLDFEKHHYEYAIMRAGNLSRELLGAFEVDLIGYDVALVADALDFYSHKISRSETSAEAHCDNDIKGLLSKFCRKMSGEYREDDAIHLGLFDWSERPLISRALEAFAGGWLQEQIDKLPPKAKAA